MDVFLAGLPLQVSLSPTSAVRHVAWHWAIAASDHRLRRQPCLDHRHLRQTVSADIFVFRPKSIVTSSSEKPVVLLV